MTTSLLRHQEIRRTPMLQNCYKCVRLLTVLPTMLGVLSRYSYHLQLCRLAFGPHLNNAFTVLTIHNTANQFQKQRVNSQLNLSLGSGVVLMLSSGALVVSSLNGDPFTPWHLYCTSVSCTPIDYYALMYKTFSNRRVLQRASTLHNLPPC